MPTIEDLSFFRSGLNCFLNSFLVSFEPVTVGKASDFHLCASSETLSGFLHDCNLPRRAWPSFRLEMVGQAGSVSRASDGHGSQSWPSVLWLWDLRQVNSLLQDLLHLENGRIKPLFSPFLASVW